MTVFLILIVLGLLGITVWQISKIFKLSQSKKSDVPTGVQDDRDNKIQAYIMMVFGIAFYAFMIYNFWEYSRFYPPTSASVEGVQIDRLFFITIVIIMIVQVITQALLVYYTFKYRGRKNRRATFIAENEKLEFAWTIIPVIVLACLIIYGLFTWSDIMNVEKSEDTLVIELYAYQFGWKARYSGADNTLGKANVRFIKGINTLGIDKSDPYGQDDKVTSVLHLPKGQKVLFKMRSQDVIHSAYFPHFRAQMNVLPGMVTQFAFTPSITTKEMRKSPYMRKKVNEINDIRQEKSKELVAEGDMPLDPYTFDYFLLCNKVCGTSHYNMQMKIIVETPEEFQKWIDEQPTFAESLKKS